MQTLDCGHAPDAGAPAQVRNKAGHVETARGWQFVLRDGKKICHACADAIILDCGHAPSPHSVYTTGYGVSADGKKHCHACCHKHDVAQLQDRSKPFTAYVSSDGKQITNWPGAALMRITAESSSRGGFGGRIWHYRAIDVHGQQWLGKGSGRGMCIKLRACK